MAGLLDFFQQDPDKQAALKQGLLNMGIQMLAGGRQELGTSLGQGLGAGVSVYQKQIDDMKKKQAMQNVFRSAYGQPPAQVPAVMKPQEATAPAAPMYGGKAPLLSMDYANGSDLSQSQLQAQPQQAPPAPAPQAPPVPAPAPQFNRDAFFRAAFENPDAGMTDTAMKYMLDPSLNKGPESMFGKIMPNAYTPASLAKYQQSNNFADLVPVAGGSNFGNVNPGQFTPESLARYSQSGDYGDLVPLRAPVQVDQGGFKTLYDPGTGTTRSFGVAPKITDTPEYIAEQERARAAAAAEAKRLADKASKGDKLSTDAQSIDSLVSEADKLLNDATGSTAGAGVAYGKGLVGISDASTQANAALNVLGGQLVAKIPRMEGPQSDADVKMYKQMAGRVADQTVPVEDRRAALRTLQSITRQYAGQQSSPTADSSVHPAPVQKTQSKADAYNEYAKAYGRATTKAQRDAINARARELGVIK